jgi:hypothetical protein
MSFRSFAGFCALMLSWFQSSPPLPEADILSRHVSLDASPKTSSDAVSSLLAKAHTPGGMVSIYSGCQRPLPQVFSLFETNLKQGLDYVATVDATRSWIYADGVVLVGVKRANGTILNTVISDIEIRPNDALSLSTQRLVHSPEVLNSIQRLGLEEITPELGFGQIPKNPVAIETRQPTQLHQITLMNALNALALMKGTAVWEYEQFACNERTSFRLNWTVK